MLVSVFLSACPLQPSPRLPTPPPDIPEPFPQPPGFDRGSASQDDTLTDPGVRTEKLILEGSQTGGDLQDIPFGYDAFDLSPAARAILQANADWLLNNPAAKVEIEGHCDNRGTVEYNLALGAERARSVSDYLVSLGIASERLSTISYGEEFPLCPEDSEGCWQQNRRAHLLILSR